MGKSKLLNIIGRWLFLLIVGAIAWPTGVFAAGGRVALVVGNSNYNSPSAEISTPDLPALVNKLESVGFDVLAKENASFYDLRLLVEEFSRAAEGAELALFYYVGHAIRLKRVNYLIPVDVNLRNRGDLQKLTWLEEVITAGAGANNFVGILDTCKNTRHAEGWGDNFGRKPVCGANEDVTRLLPENAILAFTNSVVEESQISIGDDGSTDYLNTLIDQIEPGVDFYSVVSSTQDLLKQLSANQINPVFYGKLATQLVLQTPTQEPEPISPSVQEEPEPVVGVVVEPVLPEPINPEPITPQPVIVDSDNTASEPQAPATDPIRAEITDAERDATLRQIVAVKNAIEASDIDQLMSLLPPGAARELFVELLDRYERIDMEITSTSSSNNAGEISGILRIVKMYRANGDEIEPSESYREITLTSRRINETLWSRLY